MATQIPTQKALPLVFDQDILKSIGSRGFTIGFDFTGGNSTQSYALNMDDYNMQACQTLFIDNSANGSAMAFSLVGANQKITCPPYCQGFFPVLASGASMQFSVASAGAVVVPVIFINKQVTPTLWSVQAPGTVVGTISVSGTVIIQPLGATYTNRSGAITTGATSQVLAAANGARKRLFIQNPATIAGQNIASLESLYINYTSAAGIADGNSIELQPGQTFDTGTGPITTEIINVIAATTGHRFIAREM
jgi:hypothetical protein